METFAPLVLSRKAGSETSDRRCILGTRKPEQLMMLGSLVMLGLRVIPSLDAHWDIEDGLTDCPLFLP